MASRWDRKIKDSAPKLIKDRLLATKSLLRNPRVHEESHNKRSLKLSSKEGLHP